MSLIYRVKFKAEMLRVDFAGQDLMLVKPMNFMNDSGSVLLPVLKSTGFLDSNKIVLHDDINLELGSLKISASKGAGGHNGVKSLMEVIGSKITRIRLGIGQKKVPEQTLASYVLSQFSCKEEEVLENKSSSFLEAINSVLVFGVESAMNSFNQDKK